jgi:hypothetical protein
MIILSLLSLISKKGIDFMSITNKKIVYYNKAFLKDKKAIVSHTTW